VAFRNHNIPFSAKISRNSLQKLTHRERVTTSTARRKKKRYELRIEVLKNDMLKRPQSEEAALYSKKRKSSDGSTVAPNWEPSSGRARAESRAMTLKQSPHKEYHCSTKEETGVTENSRSVKEYDGEHRSITSDAVSDQTENT
jgi:hypothetical protein